MMDAMKKGRLLPRHARDLLRRSLGEARVVVVNGPRQAGKTTLVRDQLGPALGGTFLSLDDGDQFAACMADPPTFLDRPRPVIIDEFQHAGDRLLRAIKLIVDRDGAKGQFLLAGSTRFLTLPRISESLAGRAHVVDLWPLTQGERDDLGPDADSLLPRMFESGPLARTDGRERPNRYGYIERICRGGYPQAHSDDTPARRSFFRNYVRMVTQRDVPDISRIRHVEELPRILRMLAALTAREMTDVQVAERLAIDRRTLRANYLPLLQTVYLTLELPAWSRNLVSRVSKQPKRYLVDTGLAAHLMGTDATRLAEPTAPATGQLVETFVVNELVRQAARFADELGVTLHHYRAHTGSEVDVVIESDDGRVVGIEVKSAASVRAEDFRHIVAVRDRLEGVRDTRFVRGVVLYTGRQSLSFGEGLEALPLADLWMPPR